MANVRKYGTRLANTFREKVRPKREEPQMFYTSTHHWVRIENPEERTATIGITDYGQDRMGCLKYIDFDYGENEKVFRGHSYAAMKSRRIPELQEIKMPINARITAINKRLAEIPLMLNRAPENEGWILNIQVDKLDDIFDLMTKDEYEKFLRRQSRII